MSNIIRSGQATVGTLLAEQARVRPESVAVECSDLSLSFLDLNERVNSLANALVKRGVEQGDRLAVLSENRLEYIVIYFAAAKIGAIVCALNWRLRSVELGHCIELTEPKVLFVSPKYEENITSPGVGSDLKIVLDETFERFVSEGSPKEPEVEIDPEDPLVILYTSGTTGLPKGAVISHRAFIARVSVFCIDYGMTRDDTFVAWAPMFHMASTDLSIGMPLIGGRVIIVDGFDVARLGEVIATEKLGWLVLMPGVVDKLIRHIESESIVPRGVLMIGAMADLLPPSQVQKISQLLCSPFLNSFGSTETGIPPCSGAMLEFHKNSFSLSKVQNSFCMVKIVDENDGEVTVGAPGEIAVRGPTLFSGYWNAQETNRRDFRNGWFHMGDILRRNENGTFDFVDRAKYLIKSGGENIYPAEIERVLLRDERIAEAVVVRRLDPLWGEVPVAVIACATLSMTEQQVLEICRPKLAGYKQPKQVIFCSVDDFPRSTTGKILRHEIEELVQRKYSKP